MLGVEISGRVHAQLTREADGNALRQGSSPCEKVAQHRAIHAGCLTQPAQIPGMKVAKLSDRDSVQPCDGGNAPVGSCSFSVAARPVLRGAVGWCTVQGLVYDDMTQRRHSVSCAAFEETS